MNKIIKNKCCVFVLLIFIVSGCTSSTKKSEILAIQNKRIVKLEKQLKQKQILIDQLKVNKWINKSNRSDDLNSMNQLKSLMTEKKWIEALKISGQLKKKNSRSITLAYYRSIIFKNMGLRTQEKSELDLLQNLKANKLHKRKSLIK
jgi:collagenase-like PrtC family protease